MNDFSKISENDPLKNKFPKVYHSKNCLTNFFFMKTSGEIWMVSLKKLKKVYK